MVTMQPADHPVLCNCFPLPILHLVLYISLCHSLINFWSDLHDFFPSANFGIFKILSLIALGVRLGCLFLFYFIFCIFKKHLYWRIMALQWCVSFCFIKKWISYTYKYVPISLPHAPPSLPPSLSHPSRWSQSTELISLCYVAASH